MSKGRLFGARYLLGAAALLAATALGMPAWAQTVTIMQGEPPESLEPGNMGGTYNMSVLATMYENLVALDENLARVPGLATEWAASEDGLTWTFKLREGVTFHDGTPFDATAVKFSFDRLLDEALGLGSGGRFRPVIAEVVIVDPFTVDFKLKMVYPAFPSLVAIMHSGIVNPNPAVQATLDTQGSGTGPFKFAEWRTGEYVMQEAYDGYWGDKASVEAIKWIWSAEPSVGNMALLSGDADVVNAPSPVFAQTMEANPDLTLHKSKSSRVYWAALNMAMEPFDDVKVRQALNYATDREALVGALMFGYATPANSPLGEAVFGYDDTLRPYTFDIEMAKKLLADAGYPDGIEVQIFVQEQEAPVAQALQAMWAEAGITLNVTRLETGVMSDVSFGSPEEKAEVGANLIISSFSSATLDADVQLRALYHTASWSPTDANAGFYSNPTLDAILDEASSIGDEARRKELYLEAQNIINADAPHVLLYKPTDLFATRAGIDGIWVRPGGLMVAKGVTKQ